MSTVLAAPSNPALSRPRAQCPSVQRPTVQLTRRGRWAVFFGAVGVLIALAIVLGPATVATSDAGAPQRVETVTVMPGTTLWDLAADANPEGDIRSTIDDIIRVNSLPSGSGLQIGATIAVPVYAH